ncbi:methionine gamma-lyase (L-methioninase) [Treponema primitia ZAS-2]|uniref:Methionine gamma-lyase (L-methioninase) n=1 Tax=Treponema primitia (strain ATCC BAA-887 / DSM 12427 / ZAS-2) TaxID=545694 RepID=F5YGQ2_TREPZ|nr:aminotransferase class I/II-fold pyridoxal phosphate-dependent enzyme [Treponema primitia]AEF86461.1 methionine gamma-lyase (L-methioninase) [Treponema primitia ZAS-2]
MSKKTYGKEFGFQTRAVHTGNDVDGETGAIKRPIVMANSYELPYDPSDLNWSGADKNIYTRNGGSNQRYLEEKLASLSGAELSQGDDCVVLGSGVSALAGLFFSLLKSGDHVVFSSVTYIAVYRLLNELFNKKFNVETTIVDTSDLAAVRKAVRPNTRLIHIETPGNPAITISDIRAIAAIAHEQGALLSVDNTFASPYNQRPLELGADFSVESLTKYINGHGDSMGGAIIGKKEQLDQIRSQAQINLGGVISPFNAWLIMRGSVTLPLRMRQHNENALKAAEYLEGIPSVRFVAYPGLKSHRGHQVAASQMSPGYGGVLSFGLKADHDTHNRFVSHLRVITSAVSLGHDESLIVFLGEKDERQYLYPPEFHDGFFRFSLGIEDPEDIIGDIDQALRKTGLL